LIGHPHPHFAQLPSLWVAPPPPSVPPYTPPSVLTLHPLVGVVRPEHPYRVLVGACCVWPCRWWLCRSRVWPPCHPGCRGHRGCSGGLAHQHHGAHGWAGWRWAPCLAVRMSPLCPPPHHPPLSQFSRSVSDAGTHSPSALNHRPVPGTRHSPPTPISHHHHKFCLPPPLPPPLPHTRPDLPSLPASPTPAYPARPFPRTDWVSLRRAGRRGHVEGGDRGCGCGQRAPSALPWLPPPRRVAGSQQPRGGSPRVPGSELAVVPGD
jgi:hypothetical protein